MCASRHSIRPHTVYEYSNPFLRLDNGDCPDIYCPTCSGIMFRYQSDLDKEHTRHDEEISKIRQKYNQECIDTVKREQERTKPDNG